MRRREFNHAITLLGLGALSEPVLPSVLAKGGKGIQFNKLHYEVDGQPAFLYSGEIHYFRVPKADWRRRMQLFKEAGGNCIATYVPWVFHEPREGTFVFGGEDGVRDLEGYLGTAQAVGLNVIVRPGPYVYSELKYDGLPWWLCEDYPELRAHNIEGKPFRTSSISYLHPLFLEKARRWYAHVCPLIAKHTVSKGGPVAFVQFDNELTGIHFWHSGPDYNAVTMGFGKPDGRYARFLRARYGEIRTLNRLYGTDFSAFEYVRPIASSDSSNLEGVRRAKDYLDFYLGTVAEYAQMLADWMREHGIDTPLVHNSASPAMNPLFVETTRALGKDFVLGSDHYYNIDQNWPQNNPTPQYALGCLCSLEILRLMGQPPSVFELPGGSPADWPPFTPEDAKCAYWTNIAFGMKGSNYYLFTGGPNPPGSCITTDVYDFAAAIGANGEIRPLYEVEKELGLFLKEKAWLAQAEREMDCRFAVDFEQARADYFWKSKGDLLSGGLAWDFFRKGMLTTALCASVSPVFCDLGSDEWISDQSTPLVVVSSSSLAEDKQARIVRFLKQGGRVLLSPVLPSLDERFLPCNTLAEFLGRPSIEPSRDAFQQLKVGRAVNIQKTGTVYMTKKLPASAEVLGRDERTNDVVAWQLRTEGGGQVVFLGVRWFHAVHQHVEMVDGMLQQLGLRRKVACSNPNIWTSLLTRGNKSILFLMNLHTAPMEAEIACRPGSRAGMLNLGRHKLGPISVRWMEI